MDWEYGRSMRGEEFPEIPTDAPTPISAERLVSIDEARTRLGNVTRRHVYNMIYRGELTATKLGGRRVIVESSLNARIAQAVKDADHVYTEAAS